jgi:putative peptidoglycan binding protein/L,D-transpeptidase-like protein
VPSQADNERVRSALVLSLVAIGLCLPGAAGAQGMLTLRVEPSVAPYGSRATFAGELTPAQPGVPVGLYTRAGSEWRLVAGSATRTDGSYRFTSPVRAAGTFLAVAQVDPATQVASAEAGLRVRPLLRARIVGRRVVGEALALSGRLLPADAGRLLVRAGAVATTVRVSALGRFRVRLPSDRPGRLRVSLALAPSPGYDPVRRRASVRVRGPVLALGSVGPAVHALERRLGELRYALRGVDSYYGADTYEAVLAFQKVQGLARTGRVGAGAWRALVRARVPRAFVPHGDHVEISKTKQVMFEVRAGRVVRAVHVSTGATGNTPVGRWRVYRLGPGFNALSMYYSLYFLRGFAIHGYPSVPPFPASHGCVRTPLWFAPGFYSRWGRLGTTVYVFP